MKNVTKILNVIGIIVIVVSFILKKFDYARLLELLLGVLLIEIALIYKKPKRRIIIFLMPFILLTFLYTIDTVLTYKFDCNPIFAKEVVSSNNFKNYNSIFYRIYNCTDIEYYDFFYQKSDVCDINSMDEKNINSLASDVITNFKNYKDKFYVFNGKVSFKEGNNIIDMQSFSVGEDSINGNVIFNDNITFKFYLNNSYNNEKLKVYDNVKIVGKISKLENTSGNYTIVIKDAYLDDEDLYDNFSINVVNSKSCEKDKKEYVKTEDLNYYTSCLNNLYIIYEENEVYELSYALKDKKIELSELLVEYNNKINNDTIKNELYEFNDYNILVCENKKDIIIGNKSLSLDNNYCEVTELDNEDL